jgi:major type 1 subunit fimbrin (pilin)
MKGKRIVRASWRIAFGVLALGWASTASAYLECEGGKSEIVVQGPPSITVSPAAPAGTPLTGWLDGQPDPGLYRCSGGAGYHWFSMQVQYSGSGIDTGIRVIRDGAAVPVLSTNIEGIGIAVAARVAFETSGWQPWMQGMQYPAGNVLSLAEDYNSSWAPRQGGQVSYQLVKTKDGVVNTGEISSVYSRLSEAPTGPHNTQVNGAWTEQRYALAPIRIVPLTCTTRDVNVNMGRIALRAFRGPGTTAGRKSFAIELRDCPAGIQSIDYTLDPTTPIISLDQGVVALEAGGATGVGVQLMDATGSPVPLQQPVRFSGYIPGSPSVDIPLQAAYYQTADTITAGQANTAVRFTITYQ